MLWCADSNWTAGHAADGVVGVVDVTAEKVVALCNAAEVAHVACLLSALVYGYMVWWEDGTSGNAGVSFGDIGVDLLG